MKQNMNARDWLMGKLDELGFAGVGKLLGVTRQNIYLMKAKATVPQSETRRAIAETMTSEGFQKDEWDVKIDFQTRVSEMERAIAAVDKARSATDNGPAHTSDGSTT